MTIDEGAGAGMEPSDFIGQLVSFLVARGYEPGERIPSERELGARFDVSRSQVRETISYLEALRIVERKAKSGLYMAEGEPSVEALALFARLGIPLTEQDVRQMVELRMILEVKAVELACERRTDANIARMQEILDDSYAKIDDAPAVANYDRLFHAEIVRSTQNDLFLRIVNIFYLMSETRREIYFRDADRRRQSHAEHRQLLEAIEARDVQRSVDVISRHLQGVDSYWRDFIAQESAPVRTAGTRP